jgi:hypothetical protein
LQAAAEYKVSEMDRKMRKAVNKDNKVNRSNCFDFGQDKKAKERGENGLGFRLQRTRGQRREVRMA